MARLMSKQEEDVNAKVLLNVAAFERVARECSGEEGRVERDRVLIPSQAGNLDGYGKRQHLGNNPKSIICSATFGDHVDLTESTLRDLFTERS